MYEISWPKLSNNRSIPFFLSFFISLKEIFNNFRTHVRKDYPEEYKKIQEEELDEANVTGTGASFNAGNSPAYSTPFAFGDDKKKKIKAYTSVGYKIV